METRCRSPRRHVYLFVVSLLSLMLLPPALAGWGDTVMEGNYSCPVYTTCPVICVANEASCPIQCEANTKLCPDGQCLADCNLSHPNPCENKCAPIACPKFDMELDQCLSNYDSFYKAQEECALQEAQAQKSVTFREAPFVFLLFWIVFITVAMLGYCFYNRRFRMRYTSNSNTTDGITTTTMVGYCPDYIGTLVYYGVVITIWGFQFILFLLVVLYYVNQGAITAIEAIWEDETQILLTFEIVWMVGFVWNLAVKWPVYLRSLFWRTCPMEQATHVAVWTMSELDHSFVASSKYIQVLRRIVSKVQNGIHTIMSIIFSEDASLHKTGKWTFCQVQIDPTTGSKHFVHNFRRHNLVDNEFVPGDWKSEYTIEELDYGRQGLSKEEVRERRQVVGPNTIEMKKPTFLRVCGEEFTHSYYTYQNFIMWSWMPLWYYYMAIVQSLVILIGGLAVCFFRYRNEKSLYRLTHIDGQVQVLRDGLFFTVSQADIVPGDVVIVEPGLTYCDMVLVFSTGVLVDESALTGESNPVAKTAIDPAEANIMYGSKASHKRHTIQAGTTVLESEAGKCLAVVTKTGSFTTKGELLRDIFSFQRHQFKFDVEVPVVMMILFLYAIWVFTYVVLSLSYSIEFGWFYGLYGVAAALPPLLPTVFTVSVGVSDNRLSKRNIACTNSEDILIAGKVKRAFFDKTGTLTRQGLEFISARSASSWAAGDAPDTVSDEMAAAMATCHSLTQSEYGELIGNPVDRTLFASSGAHFQSDNGTSVVIVDSHGNKQEIIKHFDFDHHRMSQSVVVRDSDGGLVAYVKGSGESISRICKQNSLPNDYASVLRSSAKEGIYQISMAMKTLDQALIKDLSHLSRDQIENDLTFLGVVNFKNVLREETPEVIRVLENGEVHCVMVTGDSLLTGVCIARESGIILPERDVYIGAEFDSKGEIIWLNEKDTTVSLPKPLEGSNLDLAVSGEVWRTLLVEDRMMADDLADHIRVFGRCNPADKVSVLTHAIDKGHITLMTGDGGNDCGALKTAHVGVALSDAEASIVAPFSSLDKTISAVVDVLREGRCSLASALASYKFMIMYGQLTIGMHYLTSYFHITLTEWMWVWIDGVFAISLGFTLPLAKPASILSPSRPTSSLLGPHTLASALGVLFINYVFMLTAIGFLFTRDWFKCRQWNGDDISNVLVIGDNYETSTLFIIVANQFIVIALTWNLGYEFREAWYKNYWLVSLCAVLLFIQYYITLVPGKLSCLFRVNCVNEDVVRSVSTWDLFPIQNDWNTTVMPVGYRFALVILMILNTIAVLAWDYFAVNGTRKRLGAKRRNYDVKFLTPDLVLEESAPL